ncbi:tetraspanin-3-like isoform X2 [Hylaeus anthracinus]|uniref:tetraspanin-3-like isoform X2 n=1 Tax=Hylaeus anthracinus TaxID=313031 RepID=UPI0023B8A9AD|nr:tetraspanin-3-like isoform X2 [Hylaeus anthracinus]
MPRTLICLRYFLIGGAIVVGVCGIVESICAGYFIYQLYEYSLLTPNHVCGSPTILLVMGLVTCLLSWCAWQFVDFTNRSQVIIFFLALIIVTIINTSTGIWALVRHERVDVLPVDYLNQVFEHAVSNDKASWDRMYFKLRCCGVNGPIDYRDHDAVPWSCCDTTSVLANSDDSIGTCNTMYAKGCHQVVINRTRSILLHVFLLALCTVLLQVGYIICMTCYMKACREFTERRNDLIATAQMLARASKDMGTNDILLSQQPKNSTETNNIYNVNNRNV